ALLFLLSLGETSVSRSALTEALQEIHDAALRRTLAQPDRSVEPETRTDRRVQAQLVRDYTRDGYDGVQLPEALATLREEMKEWMKEKDYLRARIETLPAREDRARDAKRILQLDGWIVSAYGRMDAWKVTGRDTGEATP